MRGSASEARSWRRMRVVLPMAVAVVVALLTFAALGLVAPAARAQSARALDTCPQQPVAGRHIYDCAGVLTSGEISDLEQHAQTVQQAGAPVIVYLQVKNATYDQAQSDAADLMNRWDVESQLGARDGVVILFDLTPGNTQHGEVALYAGQAQLDGPLPQDELNNIYQNDMLPDLKADDMAGAIDAALDSITSDLNNGGPAGGSSVSSSTAPAANPGAQVIGDWPFNILALLLAASVVWIGLADERRAHEAMRGLTTTPTTTPPANLKPAVAGALITGQVGDAQMEATVMDFARRGLLHIDSAETDKASLRLIGNGQGLAGYEEELWSVLEVVAREDNDNQNNRVISHGNMYLLAQRWRPALDALRSELIAHGWFDAERHEKQAPLVGLALLDLLLTIIGIVLGAMAQQPWPFIGALVCFIMFIAALAFSHSVMEVTPEGLRAAQPARDYLAGMDSVTAPATTAEEVESNAALPYFVAANRGYSFSTLHLAEDAPYAAAAVATAVATPVALYSSWLWLHNSMTPPLPPPGSGAYSGGHYYGGGFSGGFGGAASGGGGAGGHF